MDRGATPPDQRGKAMGFWGLGIVVAPMLGPVLGGWLTDDGRSVAWNRLYRADSVHLMSDGDVQRARSDLGVTEIATQLGLEPLGKTKVRYADGRHALREEVEGVYVTLLGRSGTFHR